MFTTRRLFIEIACKKHWRKVFPSYQSDIESIDLEKFLADWVEDVDVTSDEQFNDDDISLGFQRTFLRYVQMNAKV